MTKNPCSKFWWKDHEDDPLLKLCSLAAQGLWMRLQCIAARATPYGYVLIVDQKPTLDDIASLVGKPAEEVSILINELTNKGVCSTDTKGRMFSRRMVRDNKKSMEGRKHGKLGGSPRLRKQTKKPSGVNPGANPPGSPTTTTFQHTPPSEANASDTPPPGGQSSPGSDLFGSSTGDQKPASKKGSRLKPDWQPNHEDEKYARQNGLDQRSISAVAEDFRDYWSAQAGKQGVKLDWTATWRRWVREHIRRHGTGPWGTHGRSQAGTNRYGAGSAATSARNILSEDDERDGEGGSQIRLVKS